MDLFSCVMPSMQKDAVKKFEMALETLGKPPIGVQAQNNSPSDMPSGRYFVPRIMDRKRGFEPPTLSLGITMTDPLAWKWMHFSEAKNA